MIERRNLLGVATVCSWVMAVMMLASLNAPAQQSADADHAPDLSRIVLPVDGPDVHVTPPPTYRYETRVRYERRICYRWGPLRLVKWRCVRTVPVRYKVKVYEINGEVAAVCPVDYRGLA